MQAALDQPQLTVNAKRAIVAGLYTPVISVFDSSGALDVSAFRAQVERLIAAGVDGLVVAGTTGEAHALDLDERSALFQAAVRQAAGRVRVIAGTGATTTRHAERLLALAAASGCDAALVLTPWFEKPSPAVIAEYYRALARKAALPMLLYHNPSRTGADWPAAALAEVASELRGCVIGVKDSAQDPERVAVIRRGAPDGFLIFSGGPHQRELYAKAGADGCVDGPSNLLPNEASGAWKGDARATSVFTAASAVLERSGNFIALLKSGLRMLGMPAGTPRAPFDAAAPVEEAALRTVLAHAGYLAASEPAARKPLPQPIANLGGSGMPEAPAPAGHLKVSFQTLWHGELESFSYAHHAALTELDGRLFAAFTAGRCNEDSAGQTILWSASADGRNWTRPATALQPAQGARRWTCGGLWPAPDGLKLLAVRYDSARYVDGERRPGQCWENMATELLRWDGRAWQPEGTLLDDFYANEAPRLLPHGQWMLTGVNGRHDAQVAISEDPAGKRWRVVTLSKRDAASQVKLTEPSWFAARDGTLRVLLRDDGGSRRLWLSESRDGGATWSACVPSDLPDAQAKFHALALPNGNTALLGSLTAGPLRRRVLTLAFSLDGSRFDPPATLRLNPMEHPRHPGLHKASGYQYPNAIVAQGHLWMIYSVNKEDVEIAALRVEDLPA